MNKIKNVIFDIGGVLIDLDTQRSIDAFKALIDEKQLASGNAPITTMDLLGGGESRLMQLYQTGDITTDEFVNTILKVCKPGTTRAQVVDAWYAMLLSLPTHRLEMIRQLKAAGYRVYMLSNINDLHVTWTLEHFKLWGIEIGRDIDAVFFSNEMHAAKPDIRCYQLLVEKTGIRPAETLYIDDLQQNINAGQQIGFDTICAVGDAWIEPVKKRLLETK